MTTAVLRRRITGVAVALVVLVVADVMASGLHTHTANGHWQTPLPVVVLGLITGLTYGLLAVGLVLVYRTNRIINFAHGEMGAFAAAFFGIEVVRWHIPYWVALPLALALAGAVGALAELGVVRRLRNAPLIMSVVATLGVGQFLVGVAAAVNNQAAAGSKYPEPSGLPSFELGALRVTPAFTGMLILSPIVVVALALFLKRSKFGLALRSASANPDAARMAGIFASRMSSLAWALAGSLAALTAILTQPTQGFSTTQTFGPSLLLRALTAAVVARMENLPVALAAGAGLGVIEQLLLWNYPQQGLVEVVLFTIILGALILGRGRAGRTEEKGSWAAVQTLRPLPDRLRRAFWVRHMGIVVGVLFALAAALLPLVISNADAVTVTGIFAFAIIALSVGVVTGLAGQLSLGQFALAAIGALASFEVSRRTGNFVLSFGYAGLAGAGASLIIGLPALRIRGLLLTVTTLSFALVTPAWFLTQSWTLGAGKDPGRPIVAHHALQTGHAYYYVGLVTLLIAMLLARNVYRGGIGRQLIAVRDNEDNARAFTVPAARRKIEGFLIAGFIAGLGGALYGHSLSQLSAGTFPTAASIDVVKMAVIGGLGVLAGPIVGAFFVQGFPHFVPLDSAGLAATSFGQLLIILYIPRGLTGLIEPLRDRVARRLARWSGVDVDGDVEADDGAVPDAAVVPAVVSTNGARPRATPRSVLLEARELRKNFGGVQAVGGVSLTVAAGEIVGLIGPNGAGKTTTFELLAGFTRPDGGTVTFEGDDVSSLGPEARGRLGLIRSFQDAALFPTMTVLEAIMTSLEREVPTRVISELVGSRGSEHRRDGRARTLVASMGLEPYRDKQIQELSTGTRRITELACLLALQPTLLLLDEPSSGIAQRETEALGEVLHELRDTHGVTLLIIEHDIPLIMGLADRIIAMDTGAVIADGPPDVVRHDPQVVEAYLGGSIRAIERSGSLVR
jgi:ABC-type branched-subunit amino acid transport system ATPase component/branched-subunit amino acid ABC-type transport system permease component